MDLRSGTPVWKLRKLEGIAFEALPARADIVVIGAGTSGAFISDALTRAGLRVILLDKREPASGSTRACTALIQYELDTPLEDLIERIGRGPADIVLATCRNAVHRIHDMCGGLPDSVECHRRPSLYLASDDRSIAAVEREFRLRRDMGLDVELLSAEDVRSRYPWRAPCAIFHNESLELDPVELTLCLIERAMSRGLCLCADAEIVSVKAGNDGVEITFRGGKVLKCDRVVVAVGYATHDWLPEHPGKLTSTYAAATRPGFQFDTWSDRAIVWESARPYHYMRRTVDDRVIIGGCDKPFRNELLRNVFRPIESYLLRRKAREMLRLDDVAFEYSWCGTFSESDDGLPFIGTTSSSDRIFYVLASGGNGVTFSALAGNIAEDWIAGRKSAIGKLLSVERDS